MPPHPTFCKHELWGSNKSWYFQGGHCTNELLPLPRDSGFIPKYNACNDLQKLSMQYEPSYEHSVPKEAEN